MVSVLLLLIIDVTIHIENTLLYKTNYTTTPTILGTLKYVTYFSLEMSCICLSTMHELRLQDFKKGYIIDLYL